MTEKKYLPFIQAHSDFKNIFYDEDFATVRRISKELEKVLKEMEKRFERHETLNIARSVFDYATQKEMYTIYPYMYYDFRVADTRICIGCNRKKKDKIYFVSVVGFKPDPRFNKYISEYGWGAEESIEKALRLFYEIIYDFSSTMLEKLF